MATTPSKPISESVKETLSSVGEKLFGKGAAGNAAKEVSTRGSKIDAAVDKATGVEGYRKGGHVHAHKRMPSTMKRTKDQ